MPMAPANYGGDFYLVQDNILIHNGRVHELGISVLSVNSPDLNIIENIWGMFAK